MNKLSKIFVFAIISALLFVSCKKDESSFNNFELKKARNKSLPIDVNEAKKIFYSNFSIDANFSESSFLFQKDLGRKELNWDLAKVINTDSKFSIVEMPINFDKNVNSLIKRNKGLANRLLNINSQSKLLFLKDRSTGFVYTSIMTVQSVDKQISQSDFRYNDLPLNFSGTVFFSNWDGTLNNSWIYERGVATKTINLKIPNNETNGYADPNGSGQNCENYIIDTWERDCYEEGEEGVYCTDWVLIASHNVTICGGGGGGGGVYIEHTGTFDDHISDEELASCLKSVFSDLRGLQDGGFADIIRDFSGTDPNFNWKVNSAFLGASGANAITSQTPVGGYYVTNFNMTYLNGASDLSIARTMIHEGIHAYLTYYFFNRYPIYNGSYIDLLKEYRTTAMENSNPNDEQHHIMEKAFVEQVIAPALQQYGNSKGYNLDFSYYEDLAWGGLNYNGNTKLSNEDRIRITNVLYAEQTGTGVGVVKCPIIYIQNS